VKLVILFTKTLQLDHTIDIVMSCSVDFEYLEQMYVKVFLFISIQYSYFSFLPVSYVECHVNVDYVNAKKISRPKNLSNYNNSLRNTIQTMDTKTLAKLCHLALKYFKDLT